MADDLQTKKATLLEEARRQVPGSSEQDIQRLTAKGELIVHAANVAARERFKATGDRSWLIAAKELAEAIIRKSKPAQVLDTK